MNAWGMISLEACSASSYLVYATGLVYVLVLNLIFSRRFRADQIFTHAHNFRSLCSLWTIRSLHSVSSWCQKWSRPLWTVPWDHRWTAPPQQEETLATPRLLRLLQIQIQELIPFNHWTLYRLMQSSGRKDVPSLSSARSGLLHLWFQIQTPRSAATQGRRESLLTVHPGGKGWVWACDHQRDGGAFEVEFSL